MLKNRIKIGTTIDKKLFERLKALSERTRIPLSKLVDEAVDDLLHKHEKHQD